MLIGGVDPKTLPKEEILVIPKGEKSVVFRARGVPDMAAFHALVPEPKPALRMRNGGVEADATSPGYQQEMVEYGRRRLAYMIIMSLEPSEITWDTVNLDVPGTWANWEKDFIDNGLLPADCNRILNLVMEANSLNEARIKQARELFLLGQELVSAK